MRRPDQGSIVEMEWTGRDSRYVLYPRRTTPTEGSFGNLGEDFLEDFTEGVTELNTRYMAKIHGCGTGRIGRTQESLTCGFRVLCSHFCKT